MPGHLPQVVNLRTNAYDVYIGRGSPWGNPFRIGEHGNRQQVIEKYEDWILTQPNLIARIPELMDKRLGCFCSPAACHGDVLVKLARQWLAIQENNTWYHD